MVRISVRPQYRTVAESIEHIPIEKLQPYERNARTHSRKQVRAIAKSIERFAFLNPVLVSGDNRIVAGHGRVEAAKCLGLKEVPVIRHGDMKEGEIRTYILADNQLALRAGWDQELRAIELQHLVSIEFDMEAIGFEAPQIDLILDTETAKPSDPGPENDVPARGSGPPSAVPAIFGSWGRQRC